MPETTGIGATFKWDSTPVTGIATINFPDDELEMIDVEEINPTDDYKKQIPGLFAGDDVTITLNWDPSNNSHLALRTAKNNKTKGTCVLTLKTGGTATFSGYVTKVSLSEIAADDVLQAEVSIAVVSKPQWS